MCLNKMTPGANMSIFEIPVNIYISAYTTLFNHAYKNSIFCPKVCLLLFSFKEKFQGFTLVFPHQNRQHGTEVGTKTEVTPHFFQIKPHIPLSEHIFLDSEENFSYSLLSNSGNFSQYKYSWWRQWMRKEENLLKAVSLISVFNSF